VEPQSEADDQQSGLESPLVVANVLRITSAEPLQCGHSSGSSRSEIARSSVVTFPQPLHLYSYIGIVDSLRDHESLLGPCGFPLSLSRSDPTGPVLVAQVPVNPDLRNNQLRPKTAATTKMMDAASFSSSNGISPNSNSYRREVQSLVAVRVARLRFFFLGRILAVFVRILTLCNRLEYLIDELAREPLLR